MSYFSGYGAYTHPLDEALWLHYMGRSLEGRSILADIADSLETDIQIKGKKDGHEKTEEATSYKQNPWYGDSRE